MKKTTLIAALLLVVFTACEKADIHPRTRGCMEPTTTEEAKSLSIGTPTTSTATDGTGNPNSLGGGNSGNPTVDPNNPDPEGGEITDPLRKKDKDNK